MFSVFDTRRLPDIARKWLPYFHPFNLRKKHFFLEQDNLRKKFGCEPSDGDVIWAFFNALLQTRKSDSERADVYRRMGDFLRDDENKAFRGEIFHRRADILIFKSSGVVDSVAISASHDACNECKTLSGRRYSLDEAFRKPPIPHKRCTHKYGCRCVYLSIEDQETSGDSLHSLNNKAQKV